MLNIISCDKSATLYFLFISLVTKQIHVSNKKVDLFLIGVFWIYIDCKYINSLALNPFNLKKRSLHFNWVVVSYSNGSMMLMFMEKWLSGQDAGFPIQGSYYQNKGLVPRLIKWVPGISENLVAKSKLPPRSGFVALIQLNNTPKNSP